MEAIVAEVRFPMIVAQQTVAAGQDADRVHGLGAAFGVSEEGGVARVGSAVQPLALAIDVDAGLVGVDNRRLG